MKIFIKVKTNSKHPGVEKINDTHFTVSVKEPPTENKANAAIIKALANYFALAPSRINLIKGTTSHNKILDIN